MLVKTNRVAIGDMARATMSCGLGDPDMSDWVARARDLVLGQGGSASGLSKAWIRGSWFRLSDQVSTVPASQRAMEKGSSQSRSSDEVRSRALQGADMWKSRKRSVYMESLADSSSTYSAHRL